MPQRCSAQGGTLKATALNIVFRDATATDADEIVAILIAAKEASFPHLLNDHDRNVPFWTDRWRRYLTEGSTAQKSLGDGFVILAADAGRPVGFAGYHHTTLHGADAELESIYVLRAAQGRGVGTALLREVVGRLLAEGSRSLCVGYDPRNPYKRFYWKHGALEINPHWAMWQDVGVLLGGNSLTPSGQEG